MIIDNDELVAAAAAESRGVATSEQARLLAEAGVQAHIEALEVLIADVDRQREARDVQLEELCARDPSRTATAVDDHATWLAKALAFRTHTARRIDELRLDARHTTMRRAESRHAALRRTCRSLLHHDGVVLPDAVRTSLVTILDELDEIDATQAAHLAADTAA